MKILFCAAECYPFVKVGGLGDVVYSLPKALVEKGQECSVILPLYERIRQDNRDLEMNFIFLSDIDINMLEY